MAITLSDLACACRDIDSLGEITPTQSQLAAFQKLNETARNYSKRGQWIEAQAAYRQVEATWQAWGMPSAYADQVEYTRQIVMGEGTARADRDAGKNLLARAKANVDRKESVTSAWLEGFASGYDKDSILGKFGGIGWVAANPLPTAAIGIGLLVVARKLKWI